MNKIFKAVAITCIAQIMQIMFTGCQLQSVSDIQTTSINGVTVQHKLYFDEITEIDDGNSVGFKFASKNGKAGQTHYDYGWALKFDEEILDTGTLQDKVRAYTCANMTNRWYEERNTTVDGITTLQGHYENVQSGANGFATLDEVADKYEVIVYQVASDGYTLVNILAVNQTQTQLVRDQTSLLQGTLSRTEDFKSSIDANSVAGNTQE